MIKKLLPIILLLVGTGAGAGAGLFLRPPPPEPEMAGEMADDAAMKKMEEEKKEEEPLASELEYIKMSNQFVVPIVEDGIVASLIVMSLSLEVLPGQAQAVFAREPKLRDSFLKVMFDHANFGGFSGTFTDVTLLEDLRKALREVAFRDLGELVTDVLITEIARQDY